MFSCSMVLPSLAAFLQRCTKCAFICSLAGPIEQGFFFTSLRPFILFFLLPMLVGPFAMQGAVLNVFTEPRRIPHNRGLWAV